MSYTLKLQNHYHLDLHINRHGEGSTSTIPPGYLQAQFTKLGNIRVSIPGAGEVNLIDIADRHIANHDKSHWGVLISYQGKECEYRYEGEGEISINIANLGQVELSGKGSFTLTDLPSFILKKAQAADNTISANT